MQGTLETLYQLSFFPFLLAPLMAEPLDLNFSVGKELRKVLTFSDLFQLSNPIF
jgi:hypothetical protein